MAESLQQVKAPPEGHARRFGRPGGGLLSGRPLPLRRLVRVGGGLLMVVVVAVLGLIAFNQHRIARVALETRDQVLPHILSRHEMARDLERLLLFGAEVINGSDRSRRREARLSAQVLAYDDNFRRDAEIARLVQATYRTIAAVAQLRDRRDDGQQQLRATLRQAEQLPSPGVPSLVGPSPGGLDAVDDRAAMIAAAELRGLLPALTDAESEESLTALAQAVARLPVRLETEALHQAAQAIVALKRADLAMARDADRQWQAAAAALKGATDTVSVRAEMDTGSRFTEIARFASLANGLALAGMVTLVVLGVLAVWLGNRFVLQPLAVATRFLEAAEQGQVPGAGPRTALIEIRAILAAARRLATSENRYRVLVENAPDIIYSLSLKRGLFYVNGRVTSLLGYSPADVLEQPGFWPQHAHPDDRGRIEAVRAGLATATGYNYEYRMRDSSGDWRWFHDRSFDIRQVDGDVIVDGLIVDITWQKAADEALEEHQRHVDQARWEAEARAAELATARAELSQFAYAAAHDLQEPVRVIASHIQLLERRLGAALDEEGRESLRYIIANARRMKAQLHDIELFIAEDTAPDPQGAISADAALDGALGELADDIAAAGARVIRQPLPAVIADARGLQEVFTAVVGNAVDYRSPDRPAEIAISAREDDGFAAIDIADNGIGIPPSQHERIFQVFRRLHSSYDHPGTGMGLALARKIITRMGGTITVSSQEGEGATFTIRLRLRQDEQASSR